MHVQASKMRNDTERILTDLCRKKEALATQSLQERYGSAQSNSISCRFASEAVRIMGARNKAW